MKVWIITVDYIGSSERYIVIGRDDEEGQDAIDRVKKNCRGYKQINSLLIASEKERQPYFIDGD